VLTPIPPERSKRFRDFLAETTYSTSGIREVLPGNDVPADALRNLPKLLDLSRPTSTLHTLVRWFMVGAPVIRRAADHWVPAWLIETCLDSGLLAEEGDSLAPRAMLVPFDNALFATDLAYNLTSSATADVVSGINPTTMTVHRFAMHRHSRATLDLGTGCGPQAITAAAHSDHVVGTDLNPRAIEYAAFNARLNACDNVEFLTGDGFTPVAGRRFDHIIINAPFYISPTNRYLYSDNPDPLDGFCRRLIRQAPDYLTEGGCLQMMFAWVQTKDQPWKERLASWFEGTGCDAWVLRVASHEADEYALERIAEAVPSDLEAANRAFRVWMDHYRAHHLTAVHVGLLTLRRRDGQNWIRHGELPRRGGNAFGHIIERCLDNADFRRTTSDEELLNSKLMVPPDARLERNLTCRDGCWQPTSIQLTLADGIPYSETLRPEFANFVTRLDGKQPLSHHIGQLVSETGVPRPRTDRECLTLVHRLLEKGLLIGEPPTAAQQR
jgi:methyltransferase family protein